MRKLLLLAALAALSGSVLAQGQPGTAPIYKEQRGSMEFSGQMIARPKQVSALLESGMSLEEARQFRDVAYRNVAPWTMWRIPQLDLYVITVPFGSNENATSQALMRTGAFEYVEPNWIVYPLATPNDPQYGSQWHLPKIQAPQAWDLFTANQAVTVAIVDTGVRIDHEDLATQVVSGAQSYTGAIVTQADGGIVMDTHGHGTHCAGIAAARGNNGIGVSGVNWNARIMPIKATQGSSGSTTLAALTVGATWAADNGARVVSCSFSGVSGASVQTTGNYIKYQRNGFYCWAAGNSNANLSTDHPDVTIVGATTSSDTKASFSNYGVGLDLFAPGVGIQSTYATSTTSYTSLDGTSMACPCVAGVAALVMASNPALTGQQVETIVYQTCLDLTAPPGGPGNDSYWGWGRVDVNAALRRAYNTVPFNPTTMTVESGTLLNGGVAQVGASDDQYATVERAASANDVLPISVLFESYSTNAQTGRIDFILESATSAIGYYQVIAMYDFQANNWVNVDGRVSLTTDQTLTITPQNSSRFRQPGTGLMRTRVTYDFWTSDNSSPWQARFDRVGWITAP